MKILAILLLTLVSIQSIYAQSGGEFLKADDPLATKWKFMGNHEDAARLAGSLQQSITIEASTFPISSMTYSDAKNQAHPCTTKFSIKKNDKKLYLQYHEACHQEYKSKEEIVDYSIGEVKTIHTIEINGMSKDIETKKSVLTLIIDGTTYHYEALDE